MDVRHHKPLWGFGLIGWVGAAVLATMLVALGCGWDPVYSASWIIMWFSGFDMDRWMRIWAYSWAYPAMRTAVSPFGIWGLMYASVAFVVYPGRLPRWPLFLLLAVVATDAFAWGCLPRSTTPTRAIPYGWLFDLAVPSVESLLILWITRRWWCAAPFLLGVAAALGATQYWTSWVTARYPLPVELPLFTQFCTAAALMTWAILARLRPSPPAKPCPYCEYDLAGLAGSAACPECGRRATSTA